MLTNHDKVLPRLSSKEDATENWLKYSREKLAAGDTMKVITQKL